MSRIFRSIHATASDPIPFSAKKVNVELIATKGLDWALVFNASVPSSNKRADPYQVSIACKYKPNLDGDELLVSCLVGSVDSEPDQAPVVVSAFAPTAKTKFRVSCSCQDYKFTYARPNFENGYHYGDEPEAIESKGTGSPRNPERKTGSCKHILALHETLVHMKYIR